MTNRYIRGFTLVELMFAMTFIAFVMVFIVVVLAQIIAIYNKGLAMGQINQSGRQIIDDTTRSLRFASQDNPQTFMIDNTAGRFCAGGVTYVWNVESSQTTTNHFVGSSKPLRLVRLDDKTQEYCSKPYKDIPYASHQVTDMIGSQAVVLSAAVTRDTENVGVVTIDLVLATTGNNMPILRDGHWQCFDKSGQVNTFCAFGEFSSSVYMRGAK